MSDGQRVDGDDMTYWWQLLGESGNLSVSYSDNVHQTTQTLYGTMTGGDVAGLSLVDVPPVYNTKTHAERTDNAIWHLGVTVAKLSERIHALEQQLADMTADS